MKRLLVAVVAALALFVIGCKSASPQATGTPNPPFEGEPPEDTYVFDGQPGVYGGVMVLELANDIRTLNVIRASDINSTYLLWYHMFRCLVDFHNGEDPPRYDEGLCTGWEASPDSKEWTFRIRKGVRWSDGHPFTADDVLFTYDVVRDDKLDSAVRDIFIEGNDDSGKPVYPQLEKLDDYTVRFRLSKPNSGFLDTVFNLWLIPKHKWESSWRAGRMGEVMKTSDDPADVVGLGPFRIKEYVTGQRVVLERNPYFWKVDRNGNRLPYLDRLIFVIAKDFNAIQAKFGAGELDVMSRVRPEDYSIVKRLEGPEVQVVDLGVGFNTEWMAFNQNTGSNSRTRKPFVAPWKVRLFRDQKFRQAASYAIDREGLINTVFSGRGVPLYSFVTPGDKSWYSDEIMKYGYDPARARQMLGELGLKDTNNDGFLEDRDGHTIEFTINTNTDNSQRVATASFVAKNLQDVGLKANPAPIAFNQLVEKLQSTFDFEVFVLGWVAGVPPGPINTKNILLSSGLQHVSFPGQASPSTEWEAQVNDLTHRVVSSLDEGERKRLYAEIQRIWSEQLPEVNLVAPKEALAYRTRFANVRPAVLTPRVTWNAEEIYIREP